MSAVTVLIIHIRKLRYRRLRNLAKVTESESVGTTIQSQFCSARVSALKVFSSSSPGPFDCYLEVTLRCLFESTHLSFSIFFPHVSSKWQEE